MSMSTNFEAVDRDIKQRRCPKCGVVGQMKIVPMYACVSCSGCGKHYLDPYELGPWDNYEQATDFFEGKEVSFYTIPTTTTASAEVNENWIDFIKFLRSSGRFEDDSKVKEESQTLA